MKFPILGILMIAIIGCEKQNNHPCETLELCLLPCNEGYILDENGCETCECIDYRTKYIGTWEFMKYWNVSHPIKPNSGDTTWIDSIKYGNENNTLMIPYDNSINGNYIFEISTSGELIETEESMFNYFFNGYFIDGDSLYYSGTGGSPFSTTSITIYGQKIK